MSSSTRHSPDRAPDGSHTFDRLSRYDLVLAVIPAAFLVGLLAARLAGLPLRVAMVSAAAVGAIALLDGLFLNPPRRPRVGPG